MDLLEGEEMRMIDDLIYKLEQYNNAARGHFSLFDEHFYQSVRNGYPPTRLILAQLVEQLAVMDGRMRSDSFVLEHRKAAREAIFPMLDAIEIVTREMRLDTATYVVKP